MTTCMVPSNVGKLPAFIALGHELIHGWRIAEGRVAPEKVVQEQFMDPQGRTIPPQGDA